MEVRELVTKIGFGYNGAGVTQYEGAVSRVKSLGQNLGTFLKVALAGVTVSAFGTMIKSTLEFGDEILNASKITGIQVEQLYRLRMAAKLANIDQGTLNSSLVIFSSKLAKAQQDRKGATFDAFKSLGIDPMSIKDASQGFELVTAALAKQEDGFKKTAAAREFFGRSGARLIPAFGAQNTEEFLKFMRVLDAFGKGPSKEFAEQSDHINDSLDIFNESMKRLKITIVGEMYPALTKASDAMINWIAKNKDFISSGIEGSLKVVGSALNLVGRSLGHIYDLLSLIMPFFTSNMIVQFMAVIGAGFAAAYSPVLLTIAALTTILAIVDDIVTYFEGGESFFGDGVEATKKALNAFVDGVLELNEQFKAGMIAALEYVLLAWSVFKSAVFNIYDLIKNKAIESFSSMFDWMLSKIEQLTRMLSGVIGEKALGLIVKVGSAGNLSLDDLQNASKFGSQPNFNGNVVPQSALQPQNIKNVSPTFNSNATINVNVQGNGKVEDPKQMAEEVKKVAQKAMREEFRNALLNIQGLENRGLV